MNGVIQGGWNFVWAAYIVTVVVLGGYAFRAFLLQRIASRIAQHVKE
ncbi:MAG: hypothetical protein M3P06_15600 [Acidobacteriota bacterium]|nr:hypothetical protein [Acidobacteriota bacterium]